MGKRTVDWSAATSQQIERSLRLWKIRLAITAAQYAVVIGIAFWVGSPLVGAITIIVGLVGFLSAWRLVRAKHVALKAKAPSAPL